MKKVVFFLLTLLFTISLTACGSGNNGTSLPKEGVIEKSGGTSENQQTQPSSDGRKRGVGVRY